MFPKVRNHMHYVISGTVLALGILAFTVNCKLLIKEAHLALLCCNIAGMALLALGSRITDKRISLSIRYCGWAVYGISFVWKYATSLFLNIELEVIAILLCGLGNYYRFKFSFSQR